MENNEQPQALFGPTIKEILKNSRIAFDSHFGTINIVYFDDYQKPLDSGPDNTPHFLFALQNWFNHFSKINKTPTLKIETAQGKGFVVAVHPIVHHKVQKDWFALYMEREGWKNSKGEYWKDGKKFVPDDKKLTVYSDFGMPNQASITLNAPKDELQAKVLLELIK